MEDPVTVIFTDIGVEVLIGTYKIKTLLFNPSDFTVPKY